MWLINVYLQKNEKNGIKYLVDKLKFDEAIQYIHYICEKIGCSKMIIKDIEISCSEVIDNICLYAFENRKD